MRFNNEILYTPAEVLAEMSPIKSNWESKLPAVGCRYERVIRKVRNGKAITYQCAHTQECAVGCIFFGVGVSLEQL